MHSALCLSGRRCECIYSHRLRPEMHLADLSAICLPAHASADLLQVATLCAVLIRHVRCADTSRALC
eukprot:615739-Rhodomonas_salina.1